MGLDIGFDRKLAEQADLKLEMRPNNGAYDEDETDQDYIDWCKSFSEVVWIPNTNHCVTNDSGTGKRIVVRANHWGSTYAPLTEWLKANAISWEEF